MFARIVIAIALLAAGIGAVIAQADVIKARKELMKGNNDGAGVIVGMLRGRVPFDAQKADAAFAQFIETSQKFGSLFPDDSKPKPPLGEYSASLKIWENKADFNAKLAAFGKKAAENRPKAKTLDGLKTTLKPLGQSCDNCHELYRVKN
jgi:cytochrome c556